MRSAGQITGKATVTGLMRMTEPKGAFLRANRPAGDHWYSRDAGRHRRGAQPERCRSLLHRRADAGVRFRQCARGGLTIIAFPNNHLVYALTWFTLALMLAAAAPSVSPAMNGGFTGDAPG